MFVPDKNTYEDLGPRLQDMQREKWQLSNGISLLLVHDPEASQCALGLLVHAGSADDPDHARGTAHFVEHMLAGRGNAEFPEGINEYVLGQGGTYNAHTSLGYTAYYISLGNELLEGTAQRIFTMLQEPLFLKEATEAELSIIDEEFHIHKSRDGFRLWSGLLAQFPSASPLKHYHCGNKALLGGYSHKDLKKWFQDHYNLKGSTCVAISARPLSEIRSIILPLAEKLPKHTSWERNFTPCTSIESSFTFIETLQGTNCLLLAWPLEIPYISQKQHDLYLLVYVLAAEGEGSLSHTLKEKGWAESCEGTLEQLGHALPSLFLLEVKLTNLGVRKWNEVVSVIYAFLEFAASITEEQGHYLIQSAQKAQILSYQYRGKATPFNFVSHTVVAMAQEALETFPQQSIAPKNFELQNYHKALTLLQKGPRFIILGSNLESSASEKGISACGISITENSLKTMPDWEYRYATYSLPTIQTKKTPFAWPRVKEFLPEIIPQPHKVVSDASWTSIPKRISSDLIRPLYIEKDIWFGIPKDYLFLQMQHPNFLVKNPEWHLYSDVWVKIVQKKIDHLTYLAGTAKNIIQFGPKEPDSISMIFSAWEDVSSNLLSRACASIKNCSIDETYFSRVIEEMKLEIAEMELSPPFQVAQKLFFEQIYTTTASLEERKLFLKKATCEGVRTTAAALLRESCLRGVYLGQKSEKTLATYLSPVHQLLTNPYSQSELQRKKHPGLETGCIRVASSSPLPGNATYLALDCGIDSSPRDYVCTWLLSSGMDPIFMNQLREEEELGYIARCGMKSLNGRIFLIMLAQSTKVSVDFLYHRYKKLIDDLLSKLGQEPFFHECKFESLRKACLDMLTAPERSPLNFLSRIADLAFEKQEQWHLYNESIAFVHALSFDQFREFCQEKLSPSKAKELTICVEGAKLVDIP